jgi:hypothetical protein
MTVFPPKNLLIRRTDLGAANVLEREGGPKALGGEVAPAETSSMLVEPMHG